MLPASNRGAGMNIGFPDVCNTIVGPATVPIPYPNFALNVQATPFSPTVKVSMMPALNMSSAIPMTMGDEAGTAHPTIKGMGRYTMGNPIVFIDGMPAINLTCPTTGNNMNNPLGAVLVPSAVNVFYCRAGAAAELSGALPLSADDLGAIAGALSRGDEFVTSELLGSVAVVHIGAFEESTPSTVFAHLSRLVANGATSIVIDLRSCPGGELDAAVRLSSDFLADGAVVTRGVDADDDAFERVARGGAAWKEPLFVLVDGGTASAAEVFAGALRHHGRATLVGSTTYGKGSAQGVRSAKGEGVVYATAFEVLLPNGDSITRRGVAPDVETASEAALGLATGRAQ